MNNKSYLLVGGGVDSNSSISIKSLNNSNSSFKSSKFFRPLIASSLALSLSSSFSMAQSISPNGSNGNNPMVTITTGNNDTKDSYLSWDNACDKNSQCSNSAPARKVVWNSSSNGNGQTWTAKTQDSSGSDSKVVDRVELFFHYTNTKSQIWVLDSKENVSVGGNNTDNYVSVIGSKDASKIVMDFNNQGLGKSDDKINLFINFAGSSNKTAEVTKLKDLYGNLYLTTQAGGTRIIIDGRPTDVYPAGNKYKVEAESIYGDIYTRAIKESLSGWVFIKNKLEGNITSDSYSNATKNNDKAPTIQVIFGDGASMKGNIGDYVLKDDPIKREVIFKGNDGYALVGNIISYSSSNGEKLRYADQGSNFVWFYKGSMDGSIIASGNVVGSTANDTVKRGNNVVYFGDTGNKPSDISVGNNKSSSINGVNGVNGTGTYGTSFNLTGGILAQLFSTSNNTGSGAATGNKDNKDYTVATNSIYVGKDATLNLNGSGIDTSIKDRGNNGNNDQFNSNTPSEGLDSGLRGVGKFTVFKGSIVARGYASNNVYLSDKASINLNNGKGSLYTTIDNLNKGRAPKTVSNLYINGKNTTFNGNIVSDGINGPEWERDKWVGKNSEGGSATNNIIVSKGGSGSILGNIISIGGGMNNISFDGADAKSGKSSSSNDNTSTLTLKGNINTIHTLTVGSTSNGMMNTVTGNLVLEGRSNSINGGITVNGNSTLNIELKNNHSTLSINAINSNSSTAYNINTLTSSGANNTINLSGQSYGNGTTPARDHFQTLTQAR